MAEEIGPATAEVVWITPAGRLASQVNSANGRELFQWRHQLEAEETVFADPIAYEVVNGSLPGGLTLDPSSGLIDGTLTEMDEYVPGWSEGLEDYDTHNPDGSVATSGGKYATVGSAAVGEREFVFTVRATATLHPDKYLDRTFSILVVNNWSSDRDRFIREYLGSEREDYMRKRGWLPKL